MRFIFKPLPGLTLATLIALSLLLTLGTWQYHRLNWKTQLLADIERASIAPAFRSLRDVGRAIDAQEPIDFRRIDIKARSISSEPPFFVISVCNKSHCWRPFIPVESEGVIAFSDIAEITDEQRRDLYESRSETDPIDEVETMHIIGYVRLARHYTNPFIRNSPEANRWFSFNPMPDTHDWGGGLSLPADMRFFIDQIPETESGEALPPKQPDIPNNHLGYMLTWYGLALALIIIYLIYHKQEGRLGRR